MAPGEDVPAFIRANFRSVWALELLCFLRQNCDRSLTAREMVAGLRGSDRVVTQGLAALAAAGLVSGQALEARGSAGPLIAEANGSARCHPPSADRAALPGRAETLYRTSPDAVRRM